MHGYAAILFRARPRGTNKSAEICNRSRRRRTIDMLKSRVIFLMLSEKSDHQDPIHVLN